jgi:hypothetical protein
MNLVAVLIAPTVVMLADDLPVRIGLGVVAVVVLGLALRRSNRVGAMDLTGGEATPATNGKELTPPVDQAAHDVPASDTVRTEPSGSNRR